MLSVGKKRWNAHYALGRKEEMECKCALFHVKVKLCISGYDVDFVYLIGILRTSLAFVNTLIA